MKKLILVVAGLAVLFFLFRREKKPNPVSSTSGNRQTLAARSSQEPTLKSAEPEAQPTSTPRQEAEGIKASGLARQSGFKNLPFSKVNGTWELPIKFTATQKHCEMGDLDLIRIDQKRRGIQSVILTLDDLSRRRNVVYQKLDPSQLAGTTLTLKWKASEELRPLGLYICSDANESKSCHATGIGDVNQALQRKAPRSQTDKVYYFQFIQEGPQLALLDASRPQAKNPQALSKALAADGLPAGAAQKLSEDISKNHVQIGSMAARVEGQHLLIDLPENDPSCPLPQLKF